MRLWWVRHGQMEIRASRVSSLHDLNRLYNQQDEAGLSERGRLEAADVASYLAASPPDGLYSSPMMRAHETGQSTAERLAMPLTIDDQIGELRAGHLPEASAEARLIGALARLPLLSPQAKKGLVGGLTIPLYYRAWRRGRTRGGESPADLRARLEGFFQRLQREHAADARLAIFAHGYLIFTLALRAAASPVQRARLWASPYIPNGSVTDMQLSGGKLSLLRFADADHVRPRS